MERIAARARESETALYKSHLNCLLKSQLEIMKVDTSVKSTFPQKFRQLSKSFSQFELKKEQPEIKEQVNGDRPYSFW